MSEEKKGFFRRLREGLTKTRWMWVILPMNLKTENPLCW